MRDESTRLIWPAPDADRRAALRVDDGVRFHMLRHAEGEAEVREFRRARLALRDDPEVHVVDDGRIAVLHEEAAGDGAHGQRLRAGIGQAAGHEQAEVLLGGDDGPGLLVGVRRDDDLGEISTMARAASRRACGSAPRCRRRRRRGRRPAPWRTPRRASALPPRRRGFACLTMTTAAVRRGRTRRRIRRRVGVVDVVVGELLALQLPHGGDAGAAAAVVVEARGLMRVLAVAHRLREAAADGAEGGWRSRRARPRASSRSPRHRRRCGRRPSGRGGGGASGSPDRHARRGRRGGRRSPRSRRSRRRRRGSWRRRGSSPGRRCRCSRCNRHGPRPSRRSPRRVEIDDEQVDRLDRMGEHRGLMLGVQADAEQARHAPWDAAS